MRKAKYNTILLEKFYYKNYTLIYFNKVPPSAVWDCTCQISGDHFKPPVGIGMFSTGIVLVQKNYSPNFPKTLYI